MLCFRNLPEDREVLTKVSQRQFGHLFSEVLQRLREILLSSCGPNSWARTEWRCIQKEKLPTRAVAQFSKSSVRSKKLRLHFPSWGLIKVSIFLIRTRKASLHLCPAFTNWHWI